MMKAKIMRQKIVKLGAHAAYDCWTQALTSPFVPVGRSDRQICEGFCRKSCNVMESELGCLIEMVRLIEMTPNYYEEYAIPTPSNLPPRPLCHRKELSEICWWQNYRIFGGVSNFWNKNAITGFFNISATATAITRRSNVSKTTVFCAIYVWEKPYFFTIFVDPPLSSGFRSRDAHLKIPCYIPITNTQCKFGRIWPGHFAFCSGIPMFCLFVRLFTSRQSLIELWTERLLWHNGALDQAGAYWGKGRKPNRVVEPA